MTLLSEAAATQYGSPRWHSTQSVCQLNNLCSLTVAQETNTYPSPTLQALGYVSTAENGGTLQRIYPNVGKL